MSESSIERDRLLPHPADSTSEDIDQSKGFIQRLDLMPEPKDRTAVVLLAVSLHTI